MVAINREWSDTYWEIAIDLDQLTPPAEAAGAHDDLVALSLEFANWFASWANALENGDEGLQQDLSEQIISLAAAAVDSSSEFMDLTAIALAEHQDRPLNAFLLEVIEIVGPFATQYQQDLENFQYAAALGNIDAMVGALTRIVDRLDDLLGEWDGLTPPPEAADYHRRYMETMGDLIGISRDLLAAIDAEDLVALQTSLLEFAEISPQTIEVNVILTDLQIEALGGEPTGTDVMDLWVGACFDDPDTFDLAETLDVIDCAEPHHNEVYAIIDYTASETWPGVEAIQNATFEACLEAFEPFIGLEYDLSRWDIAALWPSQASWEGVGDREMVCAVYDLSGERVTGSAEGSSE